MKIELNDNASFAIVVIVICLSLLTCTICTKGQTLIPESKSGITVSWEPAARALVYEVRINGQVYPQTQDLFLSLFKYQIPDSGEVIVYGYNGLYSPPSEPVFYKFIPDDQYEPPELPSGDIPLITTYDDFLSKWAFVDPGVSRIPWVMIQNTKRILIGGSDIYTGSMFADITFQENTNYTFNIAWCPGTGSELLIKVGDVEKILHSWQTSTGIFVDNEFTLDVPAGTHRVGIKPLDPAKTVYITFPVSITFETLQAPDKVQGVQITF